MKKLSKRAFYILSWTWGLPMTLIGAIVTLVLKIAGKEVKKWGYCYYVEVGKNWGGLELGMFFLKDSNPSTHTNNHEHGHAIQNCYWGILMPFVICIPSAIRYWYRRIRNKLGYKILTAYDDIWFEGQATALGKSYVEEIGK